MWDMRLARSKEVAEVPPLGTVDMEDLHSRCMAGVAGSIAGCSSNIISGQEMLRRENRQELSR